VLLKFTLQSDCEQRGFNRVWLNRSLKVAIPMLKSAQKSVENPQSGFLPTANEKPLFDDVTRAVGHTPIVRLNNLNSVCKKANCWLKLESCNPGGSIKEKNAAYLIDLAEANGDLKPGGTIIESSSGNFGVALAVVGAVRGYKVIIVVDYKTTNFFRQLLKSYGAELVELDASAKNQAGSMQLARMQKAKELSESIHGSFYPCQHLNPNNLIAHSLYTGNEIDRVFGDSLDAIIVGVSTAGQISGIASAMAKKSPKTQIVAVDVQGSASFGSKPKPYKMTGLGLSFQPPNFKKELISAAFEVSETLSYSVCSVLAKKEGMLLGASTGAIVAAGLNVAKRLGPDSTVLMINPDRGDRYLETVYSPVWRTINNFPQLSDSEIDQQIENLEPVF